MVRHSHFFKDLPSFAVVHTVKGFCIVNEAEVDVFLELSGFLHNPAHFSNLFSSSSVPFEIQLVFVGFLSPHTAEAYVVGF